LNAAVQIDEIEDDVLVSQAYAAVDAAGFQFGLASGGPEDRIREFFEEKVKPAITAAGEQFDTWVSEAEAFFAIHAPAYLEKMRDEGYAGFNTARVIATASGADALSKLLQLQSWTATDLAMVSLCYLVYMHAPSARR